MLYTVLLAATMFAHYKVIVGILTMFLQHRFASALLGAIVWMQILKLGQ